MGINSNVKKKSHIETASCESQVFKYLTLTIKHNVGVKLAQFINMLQLLLKVNVFL